MHKEAGSPIRRPTWFSKNCTKMRPMSLRYQAVEHVAQELAVGARRHAPLGHRVGRIVVDLRCRGQAAVGGAPFDDGDELKVRRAEIAQEAVDLLAVNRVLPMDGGQDVEFHLVPAEHVQPLHHLVEGRPPGPVAPIAVVYPARPVDADADQEMLARKECAPVVVEQHAIGLEGVLDAHPFGTMMLLQRHRPLEEVDAKQGRLAALPGKHDLALAGCHRRRDQVAHIALQHRVGHTEAFFVRIELLLLEVVAIGAIDVAARPDGLGHHVEGMRRGHGCILPISASRSSAG